MIMRDAGNAPDGNQMTDFVLSVTPEYEDAIETLAEREGVTAEAIVLRAIGLYAMAVEAERENFALTFTRLPETNDLTVKEIVRFAEEEPEEKGPKLILPR